jgi:hypothetical protein
MISSAQSSSSDTVDAGTRSCCCWTRIGGRGVTTGVRGIGEIRFVLDEPATEPGLGFAGQEILELVVVSLLKQFEGCSVLIVTDVILVSDALKNGVTGRNAAM